LRTLNKEHPKTTTIFIKQEEITMDFIYFEDAVKLMKDGKIVRHKGGFCQKYRMRNEKLQVECMKTGEWILSEQHINILLRLLFEEVKEPIKINPCPVCGSKMLKSQPVEIENEDKHLRCSNTSCLIESKTYSHNDFNALIEDWNASTKKKEPECRLFFKVCINADRCPRGLRGATINGACIQYETCANFKEHPDHHH
jgi:hypothetical protein